MLGKWRLYAMSLCCLFFCRRHDTRLRLASRHVGSSNTLTRTTRRRKLLKTLLAPQCPLDPILAVANASKNRPDPAPAATTTPQSEPLARPETVPDPTIRPTRPRLRVDCPTVPPTVTSRIMYKPLTRPSSSPFNVSLEPRAYRLQFAILFCT